jgi:inward rectifier potassium channel
MNQKRKIFNKNIVENNDLGIGSQVVTNTRLIDKNGKFRVEKRGVNILTHPYQRLIEMAWLPFHLFLFSFYIVINALFALIYVGIGENALSGEYKGTFAADYFKAYFFSLQTFTTVGYGSISPACFASNVVAGCEAFIGLMIFALATGLYYAKFTRPNAKIKFSDIAVVAPYKEGINGLMLRIVNHSNSQLIDVEAFITYSWLHKDHEGKMRRSFRPLTLERQKISLFPLNWTIVHPIDEESPLWGQSAAALNEANAELIIFIKAQDITFGQMVHTNGSYLNNEILWGQKFIPMYYADESRGTIIELDKINHTREMELFSFIH